MTPVHRAFIAAAFTVAALLIVRAPRGIAQAVGPSSCAETQGDGNVLLCDDFEDGSFEQHWDINSNEDTWPRSQFVQCADGFGFGDRCAAWSDKLVFDREWGFYGFDARRPFTVQQDELYVRWYQYVSEGFAWGALEDKSVMLHDDQKTLTAYVATNRNQRPDVGDSGPGVPFVANYQDVDVDETNFLFTRVNRFQNRRPVLSLTTGRWYLFEWYLKLNTPGKSDGITRLWIDDASQPIVTQTLRMEYTDMRWLKAPRDVGKHFNTVRLTVYHQRCDISPNTCPPKGPSILDQSHRWDHLVISRAPIGPIDTQKNRIIRVPPDPGTRLPITSRTRE